jgi:tRNA(Arg) A34 adenosine deaminase TadA
VTISNRTKAFLYQAMQVAELSGHNFRHGAVAVKNGNVLNRGVNRYKMSPHVAPARNSIHAEISTLLPIDDRRGVVVYVARIDMHGVATNSKPCDRCLRTMGTWGVKKVFYTLSPTSFGEIKIGL